MAESSYPQELAARIEKRKKRRQDATVVAFLAVRADVKAALDAGYAVTTIYKDMREIGRVKCSYETFRRHVMRYIKAVPADPAPKTTSSSREKTAQNGKPKKAEPAEIVGFNYNPIPNKEELL